MNTPNTIEKLNTTIQLNKDIQNFVECYREADGRLHGNIDGDVTPENVLAFLIDNPHLIDIARKVSIGGL